MKKAQPTKSLLTIVPYKAGRSRGRISVRHKGGRSKRRYRLVDFKRERFDIPAKVETIEYDPFRSAFLARICYKDGRRSYILAPDGLKVGQEVVSSKTKIAVKIGNRMPLKFIPAGMQVYNIELKPGKGGQIVRSAGVWAQLMAIDQGYAQIKLPSSEIRLIPGDSMASIGQLSNPSHMIKKLTKAGDTRHRGVRPSVRGKAMNPVDHPHGGGEGRTPVGRKHPKTPWGKVARGVKTRGKKASDKFILKRRKKKK